jgi:hypothetical protein
LIRFIVQHTERKILAEGFGDLHFSEWHDAVYRHGKCQSASNGPTRCSSIEIAFEINLL